MSTTIYRLFLTKNKHLYLQQGEGNTVLVEFIAVATNCTKDDAAAGLNECVKEGGPKAVSIMKHK